MSVDPENLGERFLTTFNRIDEHLRAETGLHDRANNSFNRVLAAYTDRHPAWRYRSDLRRFGELRNAMVHEHYDQGRPLAVPTRSTTERIEQIRDALLRPTRVDPKFRRSVATTSPSETISSLLDRIRECDFSQFPVVTDGRFLGLVTENGLTRWLAHHMTKLSMIELAEHAVTEVLELEESRDNVTFVSRAMLVEDLVETFRKQPTLEAALITERGDRTTSFLGIVTRWDIVHAAPA